MKRYRMELRALMVALCLAACGEAADEAQTSAAGDGLPEGAEAISPASAEQAQDIEVARADYDADPDDADAIIWLGRRVGYTGAFRDAIEIFSEGIEKYPDDARMYRHRGHRWISVREFDRAIEDLSHAADLVRGEEDEVEPDGQPNARGIPTSTLQSNIHYHLALARYLQGDFAGALPSYEAYMAVTTNPDQLVAISHWWYMALRRLGRDAEAAAVLEPVTAELDVIENTSYHRLLLMYRGELDADELWDPESGDPAGVAVAYGVATWHLYNGREARAAEMYRRILEGSGWAGFGYIASEADIARLEADAGG
ncbi:hypothetical protein [Candidatus Palauibacter soopunensis]|uniref:hypothetical protein n=1 Tax=Candidatus Palauibacter soopunensis TaxID=3056739 RepID=UPI002387B9E2|nr:hypothetical protein [Candidatus Palauibacter soopunensis]MDE2877453.1 hypothetical protein [Candidatus Palauibacter soopunensis]